MDVFEAVMAKLDEFPSGAPRTEQLRQIVEALFSVEEAKLACQLSLQPFREPLSRICSRTGYEPGVARALLEAMANKGLVFAREKGGEMAYALLPLVPGIFELQFMTARTDPKARALAKLFDDYYFSGWGEKGFGMKTAVARTIPIQRELPVGQEVQTYERVRDLIRGQKYSALTNCFCRHEHELLGKGCGRPKEVCMIFGPFVDFAVERGFARRTTADEMLRALDVAEAAGLVHLSDNLLDRISFMCNCCGCCCGFLGAITKLKMPAAVAHSPYRLAVDEAACTDCGDCAERCQVRALWMEGDELKRDLSRCIGCGVCVSACESSALQLERRPDAEVLKPFPTLFDLGMAVVKERAQQKSNAGK
jgi:ferredoxin